MSLEPADEGTVTPASGEEFAVPREQLIERINYLFRLAGNNPPAVELRQQIMTYRLTEKVQ